MQAILVAEDERSLRETILTVLSELGDWSLYAVENGRDLLTVLESVTPSLIVLDVQMPLMSGIEAYHRLRERPATANVPVLFVTANTVYLRQAALEGHYAVLEKPYDIDNLQQYVLQALEGAA